MRQLNDYVCETCGVVELYVDPTIQQYCDKCKSPLTKQLGTLTVLHPMKGKWNKDISKKSK